MNDESKLNSENQQSSLDKQPWISADRLLRDHDAFVFDLDGVLWRSDQVVPKAPEAIHALVNEHKKAVFFATNNSMHSSKQLQDKIERLGFGKHSLEFIYCSSGMTAEYLKQNKITGNILVLGPDALVEAISGVRDCKIKILDDRIVAPKEIDNLEFDLNIQAVVLGFEHNMTYYKMAYATILLRRDPSCHFIITNLDLNFPSAKYSLPGTGSICQSLIFASGREPIVIGKPNVFFADHLISKFNYDRRRVCMIGDNILTDILFGCNSNFTTCLVESGIHNKSDIDSLCIDRPVSENSEKDNFNKSLIPSLVKPYRPDSVLSSVADFLKVKKYNRESPISRHDVRNAITGLVENLN